MPTDSPSDNVVVHLPDNFLLGTATAAHQVEGGLDDKNDYGLFSQISGGEFLEPAGMACDQYNRYQQDVDLMAGLGMQAYRFGIEWARIEPEPGVFDQKEIEHYGNVLLALRNSGIVPVPTLHHFTSPKWLIRQGGWESDETPELFARFARLVAQEYGDLITGNADQTSGYLCTLNEINTGALNATAKGDPDSRAQQPAWREACNRLGVEPNKFRPWQFASSDKAVETIIAAHTHAVAAVKSVNNKLRIGLTMASQDIIAVADRYQGFANKERWLREDRFWAELKKTPHLVGDFIGVQSYTHLRIGRTDDGSVGYLPARDPKVKQGYEFAPYALANCLRHTREVMGDIPLLCTEFGIGTDFDIQRLAYLQQGLAEVVKCIEDGVKVEGLLVWSLLDNFEWEMGFPPRYGIVHVEYSTQERQPKDSAHFLTQIAHERQLEVPANFGIGGPDADREEVGISFGF